MGTIGVAIDLGTSGFRAQAVDLAGGNILSTSITARHPLPGANVMDHLNFAIEMGLDAAHTIVVQTVNQVIGSLGVPLEELGCVAVCGNPIQLSIFEEIEVRDLAYAGENKRRALGITSPDRNGKCLKAADIRSLGIPGNIPVYIPPSVKHEIGADALAMMIKSGMLEKGDIALVTDYGTNAEMALKVGDRIITGSCAAGPAMEGQHIHRGMLASPGAITDVSPEPGGYRCLVLDQLMNEQSGDVVDMSSGRLIVEGSIRATGITGTGVVAALCEGLKTRMIKLPEIDTPDAELHLSDGVTLNETDLTEAGKAIGAVRAGYITLAREAGIDVADITVAYMAGASGTYVDAVKAQKIGMVPPGVKHIFQIGNTSLALARDIVTNPETMAELSELARNLRANHCMFGTSQIFEKAYILELAYWGEGMSWDTYKKFARRYMLPVVEMARGIPEVSKVKRDIDDVGSRGLTIISRVGLENSTVFPGCTGCGICVETCPENALSILLREGETVLTLQPDKCNGTACRRCHRACPEKIFDLGSICTPN